MIKKVDFIQALQVSNVRFVAPRKSAIIAATHTPAFPELAQHGKPIAALATHSAGFLPPVALCRTRVRGGGGG